MVTKPYSLFSVLGIEIEYMIVDKKTFNVLPICDQLIESLHGQIVNEVELGDVAVSNEFVLHVLELKTNGPKAQDFNLASAFAAAVQKVNQHLDDFDAVLLPSAMHPWYQPSKDVKLWQHDNHEIYSTYDRIFKCSGHGFANIQSIHVNLPFASDDEFVRLHSGIRVLLPILPALAASSPFCEGGVSGWQDTRLRYYGANQKILPSISGAIIPDFVSSIQHYHDSILQPMYRDIAPLDVDNILQEEWLNSRGCIARFDRDAIEIRLLDTQEAPMVDCALALAVSSVLEHLLKTTDCFIQQPLPTSTLVALYEDSIRHGLQANHFNKHYCQQLGLQSPYPTTTRDLWHTLIEQSAGTIPSAQQIILERLLSSGNLATRLTEFFKQSPSLPAICQRLSDCLQQNEMWQNE